MNPSGPPIQQMKDSTRATRMGGDFCVISRPCRPSGIPPSRRARNASPAHFLNNTKGDTG
jgi:hypothetical protein